MEFLTRTVWLLSLLCTCQCDRFRNFEDRLRLLDRRISAESEVRSHDISTVFRRLDEMDLLINTTLEETFEKFKSDGVCGSSKTVDEEGAQQEYRKLRSDIKVLRLAFQSQKLNSLEIREKYTQLERNFEQLKQNSEEKKQVMITTHKSDRDEIGKKFEELRTENEQFKRKTEEERQVMVIANKRERDESEKKFAALSRENLRLVEAHKNDRDVIERKFAALSRENQRLVEAHKNDSDETERKFAKLRQDNVHLLEALKFLAIRPQKHERVHVQSEFSSCKDAFDMGFTSSGLIYLKINDEYNRVLVYCDQETDNGGWTVFQRRKDGSEDFYRDWDDYRDGFGYIEGEFWLGNKYIHALTGSRSRELRIDMEDFEGNRAFAKYKRFRLLTEAEDYALVVGEYTGNAGDALTSHSGQRFTTKDRDNDLSNKTNCAYKYSGAWWFLKCYSSHLNGLYYTGRNSEVGEGVAWYYWKSNEETYSLKFVEMKMR